MVPSKALVVVVASMLVSMSAFGGEPRMDRVQEGYVFPDDGWALNEEGKQKLQLHIDQQTQEISSLKAQNVSLQNSLKEMEKKPALTFKGGALLVGIGLVVGLLGGVTIGVLAKR